MRPEKSSGLPPPRDKLATGIAGFDALSHGGLSPGRTSLLIGGPGAGKTLFAMQTLVNAVRLRQEAGIFVAFEEPAAQIMADAAGFDWNLPALVKRKLFLFEARLSPDDVPIGEFDLRGMLAMLDAKRQSMDARWIVFDGIDVLLRLLNDPLAEMRKVYRIRDWLASKQLTALVTAKTTLAGKFAEAACLRGERTLFVSFDEGAEPIQRNLSSVGIKLTPHVKSGPSSNTSARAWKRRRRKPVCVSPPCNGNSKCNWRN